MAYIYIYTFCEQLQKVVVENILAFNEGFWIRLAARTDTCKSEDDKAWFLTWLMLPFSQFFCGLSSLLLCLKMPWPVTNVCAERL